MLKVDILKERNHLNLQQILDCTMRKRGELLAENGRSLLIEKEISYQIKEMKEAPLIWSWKGEGKNIALLFFLYLLQGIPLGLTASIPLMLQNRHVSYKEQAEFSLVFWPFSLKLLWAPIVDSLYSSKMGRRKTWVIVSFMVSSK